MTKAEHRKEWEARVAAFRASGQSTTGWCAAHDLKPHQLRSWLRRLKPVDTPGLMPPAQWMSVDLSDLGHGAQRNGLRVRVGHAVIEVQPGFNPALLLDVVRTLAVLC